MVEGYFDFAQVFQSGVQAVVASCGTALTPQQAQYLGRFTKKVVLSFDPDAAGQGATVKSCEMLVDEGFEVNVATLPAGQDPDTFIQRQGAKAYGERLKGSQPYLEYLLERVGAPARPEDRRGPGQIPRGHAAHCRPHPGCHHAGSLRGPAGVQGERHGRRGARRDQEGRGPASDHDYQTGPSQPRALPALASITKAEKGLIWLLIHDPGKALAALDELEPADLEGLALGSVLDLAKKLKENSKFSPTLLLDHSMAEAPYITGIASESEAHVHDAAECVRELKRRALHPRGGGGATGDRSAAAAWRARGARPAGSAPVEEVRTDSEVAGAGLEASAKEHALVD